MRRIGNRIIVRRFSVKIMVRVDRIQTYWWQSGERALRRFSNSATTAIPSSRQVSLFIRNRVRGTHSVRYTQRKVFNYDDTPNQSLVRSRHQRLCLRRAKAARTIQPFGVSCWQRQMACVAQDSLKLQDCFS